LIFIKKVADPNDEEYRVRTPEISVFFEPFKVSAISDFYVPVIPLCGGIDYSVEFEGSPVTCDSEVMRLGNSPENCLIKDTTLYVQTDDTSRENTESDYLITVFFEGYPEKTKL